MHSHFFQEQVKFLCFHRAFMSKWQNVHFGWTIPLKRSIPNFWSCNITLYLLFYPHLFHLQLDLFETTQHFLKLRDHLFDLFPYCSLALPLLAMLLQTRVSPRLPYVPLRSVHLQPVPECPGAAQLAGGYLGCEKTRLIRVQPVTVWLFASLGSLLVMPEWHPSPLAMSVIFRLMNVVPFLNVGWVAPVTSDLQNMVAVEGMQQLWVIPPLDASALQPDLLNATRVPPVARMPVLLRVNRRRSSPLRSLHPQLLWERGYCRTPYADMVRLRCPARVASKVGKASEISNSLRAFQSERRLRKQLVLSPPRPSTASVFLICVSSRLLRLTLSLSLLL